MATPQQIRDVFQRYVELVSSGAADQIAKLYTEDATVEDPIGAQLRQGQQDIFEFYKASAGAIKLELSGPVRVCGHEAAAPMLGTIGSGENTRYIDIVDVMTFAEDGRVTSMRAFWSPDAIREA